MTRMVDVDIIRIPRSDDCTIIVNHADQTVNVKFQSYRPSITQSVWYLDDPSDLTLMKFFGFGVRSTADVLDSLALITYAEAMALIAEHGVLHP